MNAIPATTVARLALAMVLMTSAGACSSTGGTSAEGSGAPVGRSQAATPAADSSHQVSATSTLDGRTALPARVHWRADPSVPWDQVSEVDFMIDGKLGWVEHHVPYFYGDDGGYLVTTFLAPGEHAFTVRVITVDGQTGESTVERTVAAAPAPPDELARGSWTRTVTRPDQGEASSAEPPPAGHWTLTIDRVGWTFHDPDGGAQLWNVAYRSGTKVELRTTIEQPPYPDPLGGSICGEPDRSALWTYTIGGGGRTLTLQPVGRDPCGDRIAILAGTWARMKA